MLYYITLQNNSKMQSGRLWGTFLERHAFRPNVDQKYRRCKLSTIVQDHRIVWCFQTMLHAKRSLLTFKKTILRMNVSVCVPSLSHKFVYTSKEETRCYNVAYLTAIPSPYRRIQNNPGASIPSLYYNIGIYHCKYHVILNKCCWFHINISLSC